MLSVFLLIGVTALSLVQPMLLQFLIDDIVIAGRYEWIPHVSIGILCIAGVRSICRYYHQYTGHLFGIASVYDLRTALYDKLQGLSFSYYDNAKTGDLMARLTGDVEAFRMFLSFGIAQLLNIVLMVVLGMVVLGTINVELTLITLAVTMPLLAFVSIRFDSAAHPAFSNIRKAIARMSTRVQENITGVRTVKSFSREAHEIDKFATSNDDYMDTHLRAARLWSKYFPLMETLGNLSLVIMLGYGGFLVIQGKLTPGGLAAFFTLTSFIVGPLQALGFQINNLTQAKAAGERLMEILDTPQHVREKPNAKDLTDVKGASPVRGCNVSLPGKRPGSLQRSLRGKAGFRHRLAGGDGIWQIDRRPADHAQLRCDKRQSDG